MTKTALSNIHGWREKEKGGDRDGKLIRRAASKVVCSSVHDAVPRRFRSCFCRLKAPEATSLRRQLLPK